MPYPQRRGGDFGEMAPGPEMGPGATGMGRDPRAARMALLRMMLQRRMSGMDPAQVGGPVMDPASIPPPRGGGY